MQWRSFIRFRLLTLFVALTVLCVLVFANTRRHSLRLLGHVSGDLPDELGFWILGHDYGWPWSYRTESFKTEHMNFDGFDHVYGWRLLGDLIVGVAILAGVIVVSELILRHLPKTLSLLADRRRRGS